MSPLSITQLRTAPPTIGEDFDDPRPFSIIITRHSKRKTMNSIQTLTSQRNHEDLQSTLRAAFQTLQLFRPEKYC